MKHREYLGDGLYAGFDGHHIILAASNGIYDTNIVYLDPDVLKKFYKYIEHLDHLKKSDGDK